MIFAEGHAEVRPGGEFVHRITSRNRYLHYPAGDGTRYAEASSLTTVKPSRFNDGYEQGPPPAPSRRRTRGLDFNSGWIFRRIEDRRRGCFLPRSSRPRFPRKTVGGGTSNPVFKSRAGVGQFQVMRRSHSSLMDDLGIDPQVRADEMGHGVDVNQNEYTQASLEGRKQAVNALEKAVGVM